MRRRKCQGGCGRWLTSPDAVALGYGRICAERLGIPSDRQPHPRRPPRATTRPADAPPEVHPDQTALTLQPMQPSLWSL
ncbi:hypothetical protein SUDANB1_07129 [Streptomyces sp. enrichment culture]